MLASQGTARGAGEDTNVLFRSGPDEDPWVGCEGSHSANTARMLWGEDGTGYHTGFKNTHQGFGLFVR